MVDLTRDYHPCRSRRLSVDVRTIALQSTPSNYLRSGPGACSSHGAAGKTPGTRVNR